MEYTIVYEVTDESTIGIWLPLLFVVAGLGVGLVMKGGKRILGFFIAGLALMFSYFIIPDQISDYKEVTSIHERGEYKNVEGEIEDFVPMPYGGRANNESFTVRGVFFEYAEADESFYGFNSTKAHGGPITGNGQKVKIGYISRDSRNIILKIEIVHE